MAFPKVAVQVIAYARGEEELQDLRDVVESLKKVDYPRESWCFVFIDNPAPQGNAQAFFDTEVAPLSGKELPEVKYIAEEVNTGFAGGHNTGYELSKEWEADYVYLLNQDAVVNPTFLRRVVEVGEANGGAACVQSCIVLREDPTLLNSRGNALHYLGFGFSLGSRQSVKGSPEKIPMFYASGAGVLIRASAIEHIGLFDSTYFMYHDDVDFSWRARIADYEVRYAPDSIVAHRYDFSRSITKFYWMERNRHMTNLANYEWKTLVLILPMVLFMEIGTLIFAFRSGWWKEKIRSWAFFLLPSTWKHIHAMRKHVASIRSVSDKDILPFMADVISNQDAENALLNYVGNPLMRGYFYVAKFLLGVRS